MPQRVSHFPKCTSRHTCKWRDKRKQYAATSGACDFPVHTCERVACSTCAVPPCQHLMYTHNISMAPAELALLRSTANMRRTALLKARHITWSTTDLKMPPYGKCSHVDKYIKRRRDRWAHLRKNCAPRKWTAQRYLFGVAPVSHTSVFWSVPT